MRFYRCGNRLYEESTPNPLTRRANGLLPAIPSRPGHHAFAVRFADSTKGALRADVDSSGGEAGELLDRYLSGVLSVLEFARSAPSKARGA